MKCSYIYIYVYIYIYNSYIYIYGMYIIQYTNHNFHLLESSPALGTLPKAIRAELQMLQNIWRLDQSIQHFKILLSPEGSAWGWDNVTGQAGQTGDLKLSDICDIWMQKIQDHAEDGRDMNMYHISGLSLLQKQNLKPGMFTNFPAMVQAAVTLNSLHLTSWVSHFPWQMIQNKDSDGLQW